MWRYLIGRAVQSLPRHLLAADPAVQPRLRRFAGRTACVAVVQGEHRGFHCAMQFQPSGEPALSVRRGLPDDCDLLLERRGGRWRLQGDRQMALRLLAIARRYRPDLEEGLEIWFGTLPAGAASHLRQQLSGMDMAGWRQRLRQLLRQMRPMSLGV